MKHKRVRRFILTAVVFLLLALCFTSSAVAYQTATDFRYPLDPGGWFLIQDFGVWNVARNAFHLAEDLYTQGELPVYAPANGQVKYSGYQSGYGYVLVIEHRLPDNTLVCSVLGHLKRAGLAPAGANVTKGQRVGFVSDIFSENGGYTFPHLHFGIRSGGYSTVRDADGRWRYRGYTPFPAIRDLWYKPSDFINARNAPAPAPAPVVRPALSVNPSSLSFGFMPRWVYSSAQTYTVTGSNLSGNVTIEAPPGYWISFTNSGGYAKALTLQPRSGSVNRTIFVRFMPTRTGSFSGDISNSTPGTFTRNVGVRGWGY